MDRVHQSTAGHGQAEAIAEPPLDAAEGQAALFIEDHGERDGLRAQLHCGGAERVRGLQRVAALHAATTWPARADRHAKFVDHGTLHRQVFLLLRDHPATGHRSTAGRTRGRQWRLMRHIDAPRPRTIRLVPIRGARLAPRTLGMLLRQAPRKRRGLAIRAAARHLEFFFQPLVLTPQILDDLLGITRRRRILSAARHDTLMPDSRIQYKKEMLSASVCRDQ
jgi:hypothetical protein